MGKVLSLAKARDRLRPPPVAPGLFTIQVEVKAGGASIFMCSDVPDHLNNQTLKDILDAIAEVAQYGWGPSECSPPGDVA